MANGKTYTKAVQQKQKQVNNYLGKLYAEEMNMEAVASRRCLEKIPLEKVFNWKPHETSMQMGYLAIMTAEIPAWITYILSHDYLDFATWENAKIKTNEELLKRFDKNMKDVIRALRNISNEELMKPFSLKDKGKILDTSSKKETISSLINHWVHHRGQLTVYMRLNGIYVPSIYGPSADENIWK